jgi:hypothetical protein
MRFGTKYMPTMKRIAGKIRTHRPVHKFFLMLIDKGTAGL